MEQGKIPIFVHNRLERQPQDKKPQANADERRFMAKLQ